MQETNNNNKDKVISDIRKKYQSISFFRRIFSWKDILDNILNEINKIEDNQEIIALKERINDLDKQIIDNKNEYNLSIEKTKNDYQIRLNEIKRNLEKAEEIHKSNLIETKTEKDKIINQKENELSLLKLKINTLEEKNKELLSKETKANAKVDNINNQLSKQITILNEKLSNVKNQKQKLTFEVDYRDSKIKELNDQLSTIKTEKKHLEQKEKELNETIKKDTEKLVNIFNRAPGSKGKLAELRLEDTIKTFIDDESLYTFNLAVNKSIVEFAIRTDKNSKKWIPVDSKMVVPDVNVDGEVIDDKYLKRIETQARKIKDKYVDKSNTEKYGILVLPNDYIFTEISQNHSEFLDKLYDYNVYISSPNMFIQFIRTISNISNEIKLVENISQVRSKIKILQKHIQNFYKNSKDAVEKINIAFDKNLKNIENNIELIDKGIDSISKDSTNKIIEVNIKDENKYLNKGK